MLQGRSIEEHLVRGAMPYDDEVADVEMASRSVADNGAMPERVIAPGHWVAEGSLFVRSMRRSSVRYATFPRTGLTVPHGSCHSNAVIMSVMDHRRGHERMKMRISNPAERPSSQNRARARTALAATQVAYLATDDALSRCRRVLRRPSPRGRKPDPIVTIFFAV